MAGSDGIRQGLRKHGCYDQYHPVYTNDWKKSLYKQNSNRYHAIYSAITIGISKCSVLMLLLRYSPDPDFPEEISTSSNTLINQKNTNNTRIGITQDVISITATASTK